MTMEETLKNIIQRLGQLETHIINLIVPIQSISDIFCTPDHVKQVREIINQPLQIDDRELAKKLKQFKEMMGTFDEGIKSLDLKQTFDEMKFIGKRMDAIERNLSLIREEGLTKKVDLSFTCDGYELVKKPVGYEDAQIEEPHKSCNKLLDGMRKNFKDVICYRHGLLGYPRKTQKEIAQIMQCSVSTVRMMEEKGYSNIRRKILNKEITKEDIQPKSLRIKCVGGWE